MTLKTDIRIQSIKKVTEEVIHVEPLHIRVKSEGSCLCEKYHLERHAKLIDFAFKISKY